MKPVARAAAATLACSALLMAACGGDAPAPTLPPVAPAVTRAAEPAAVRPPTVVIDAGHGADEVGASNHGVVEKHSNLDMALRVERILADAGVRVVLTRREDRRVGTPLVPAAGGTFPATRFDLQARVDLANAEDADLFVSIHSNGSTSAFESGVEIWYDPNRPFGDRNRRLAEAMQASVLDELRAWGYAAVDRGIKDDTCFRFRRDRCFPLFLLGPERVTTREELLRRGLDPEALGLSPGQQLATTRATQMPGVLAELLFVSNATDAAVLRDEGGRDALARGVARAILGALAGPLLD
jgi:N-acetylmuramoyl-L-alanine amidase